MITKARQILRIPKDVQIGSWQAHGAKTVFAKRLEILNGIKILIS